MSYLIEPLFPSMPITLETNFENSKILSNDIKIIYLADDSPLEKFYQFELTINNDTKLNVKHRDSPENLKYKSAICLTNFTYAKMQSYHKKISKEERFTRRGIYANFNNKEFVTYIHDSFTDVEIPREFRLYHFWFNIFLEYANQIKQIQRDLWKRSTLR